ncbi:Mdfic [Phodopus roborovskii]|uniref:Mdfic protein n=1 Tax=Phodopus roborovskii TaxID=109678 RepID=A0AAU9YU47_PHORO|nr:Mdfic [Phodopus roborovskii]
MYTARYYNPSIFFEGSVVFFCFILTFIGGWFSSCSPCWPGTPCHLSAVEHLPNLVPSAVQITLYKMCKQTNKQKIHKITQNCCVHCILACLFCEFLTLCNIVLGQASCGICSSEACCCCCGDEMGDDCNCPCDMDCGIMDACCESSDCLEICMECCGICFPS